MMRTSVFLTLTTTLLLTACGADQPLEVEPPLNPMSAASAGTARITVVLDMQPNRQVDVPFRIQTGGQLFTSFKLDDDINSSLPRSRTFSLLGAATYKVLAGPLARLTTTQIRCQSTGGTENNSVDLGAVTATIHLEAGERVTCTFVGNRPPWVKGQFVTRAEFDWDTSTDWQSSYQTVYAASFGLVEVGIPGNLGYSIQFTSTNHITDYFVAAGRPAPLTTDFIDPTSTTSGTLGGETLALRLTVDYSAAGRLGGTSHLAFGGLTLCNMANKALNGTTVLNFLGVANTALGFPTSPYSVGDVTTILLNLTDAFAGGVPQPFAQDHLVSGACP